MISSSLSITVETLKEFRTILLGQKLRIYTDHKKLTCNHFNTERVLRRRIIIEEYGPDIEFIKCTENIAADTLSRFTLNGNQETTQIYTYQKEKSVRNQQHQRNT